MNERIKLNVGDRIKIGSISPRGRWWTIKAAEADGGRYAIATCQAPFERTGTVLYTIIDLESRVCGPCNLIGNGYDLPAGDLGAPWRLLAEIKTGELEISRRRVARFADVVLSAGGRCVQVLP